MRETFPDGCATALIGAAPNAISASIVLRLFMRTPRVARRQCKPRIQRMDASSLPRRPSIKLTGAPLFGGRAKMFERAPAGGASGLSERLGRTIVPQRNKRYEDQQAKYQRV